MMEAPEATGRVMALIEAGGSLEAEVSVETGAACARCREGRGCGAALFGRESRRRVVRVEVPPGVKLAAGDTVRLSISGTALLTAAAVTYGLPLSGLLFGALSGHLLAAGDVGALLGALAGLVAGAWFARRRAASLCWQHGEHGPLRLEAGVER